MNITKTCKYCGNPCIRRYNETSRDWNKRKYCSTNCANKGLIKIRINEDYKRGSFLEYLKEHKHKNINFTQIKKISGWGY